MKIGDLVRERFHDWIGIIVDERVLENAKEINRMYKVDWLDGSSYLTERCHLEVINEDR